MNNLKKNIIYNIIYQILILIIPLIMTPYLSRVIGSSGVGIYSYTYSIVYYFMLFTLLGLNNYGNRTIAKVRDDKDKLSRTFWSIYSFQVLMGIIMLFIYFMYIILFCENYKVISFIDSMFILSSMLDINWFFFGLEEFKKTIIRSTFVKILSVILIFIFVKNESDVWIYSLIMSSTTLLSQILLFGFLKGKIKFINIESSDIIKHIKPNITLFVPVIAVSLYKMMDKIMLGILTNINEVGFYENAEKIVNIPTTIIAALGTVMLPRMSNIIAKGKNDKAKEYINKSIQLVMFAAFPMAMGIAAIAKDFAPFYFGNGFEKSGGLMILLSITLPFISFANVIRTQYLIPKEKDKIYIKSVILGAIINFVMNILFISKYKSIGACIGTISAEIIVMLYQTIAVRKELPITNYLKDSVKFLVKALIMYVFIYMLGKINILPLYKMLIQIFSGIVIYILLNLKFIIVNYKVKKEKK